MTIEQIAELSAAIVKAKEKVSFLEDRIIKLKEVDKFSAQLEISIGESRYTSRYHLSKEELIPILENRLSSAKEELTKAIEKYDGYFDPAPIVNVSENVQQTTNVITTQNIVNDEL